MEVEKELLAPCGLYCGVCAVRMAHRDNNLKLKELLAPVYGVSPEQVRCRGCLSDEVFSFCTDCRIKTCNQEKGYDGCHQCSDFPCEIIENFPYAIARKVILRAIPQRREIGTEKWVEAEEKRYHCPGCGAKLTRGAPRCWQCGNQVDVD
jgi:hypothetical protein